jgi:hypothetical protein
MRPVWKKLAAIGFLTFLVLWVAGIVRGWSLTYPPPPALQLTAVEDLNPSRLPSANNMKQLGLVQTPLPLVLDQPEAEKIRVFDKSAHLALGSPAFDGDEAVIRSALADYGAVVFNERKSGIAPDRRLTLEIGVPPDRFDGLVAVLRQVGQLQSVSEQQQDRTGEFRRLNAQRQSLKKYLEAVQKLRGIKAASVDDELRLEQRAQEIEKELQTVGVQLGDLLGKESYYHVYVTLSEYQPGDRLDRTYSLPRRLGHALLWAAEWWLALALAAGVAAAAAISVRVLLRR